MEKKYKISETERKALVIGALAKMVSNKEAVKAYLRGERDIESLNQRGIKLAKPI